MNPTENEAKAARVPVTGSKDGKKTSLKIRAAAVPKMKKSYHSIVVPMRLAKATLRDEWGDGPPRVWCAVSRRVSGSREADTRGRSRGAWRTFRNATITGNCRPNQHYF